MFLDDERLLADRAFLPVLEKFPCCYENSRGSVGMLFGPASSADIFSAMVCTEQASTLIIVIKELEDYGTTPN